MMPPDWKERPQIFRQGTMGGTFALFSTHKPDQDLCYRHSLPDGGIKEGCDGQRLGRLAPGDVVLFVSYIASPMAIALPEGEALVVDGHDARLSRDEHRKGDGR